MARRTSRLSKATPIRWPHSARTSALGAEPKTEVHRGDAVRFVAGLDAGQYDVALADPPFATDLAGQIAMAWRAVPFAEVLAVEHARKTELSGGATRRWGDIAVTFYRTP